jgi:UDP-N-acetylmuramate dehydrogenase
MLKDRFEKISSQFSGQIEYDLPRAKYAYYRIGGKASVIATPRTMSDLSLIHTILRETSTPFFILGWGSNLLFSDADYPGVIIRMKHLFTEVDVSPDEGSDKKIILKLGASLGAASFLKVAAERGYGGVSCLTGIPGSVGGMIAMNAGTHLGEIGPSLLATEYVNLNDDVLVVKTRTHAAIDFSYRKNHFLKPGDLVTHTYLRASKADPALIKSEINAQYQRRKETQPVNLPSCGSVFMNPCEQGKHAWQVIDELKLRGHQIGQAQISEKHSNFIVNLGNAKASDVKALVDLVKERALCELKIELHEEVKFIP